MVEYLHPTNIEQNYVLYASQVVFELHYDSDCVHSASKSEACFLVQTLWQGKRAGFQECASKDDPKGINCSLALFKQHMANIWYDGPDSDDLDLACTQPIKPYGFESWGFLQ